ncbi:Endoribonuclease ysh1 [Smittium culicis]|uniref:Endoribonuclease YSH1 n=1 Tax=Smittium culicis TaxID=133412 RepID=A0A1R1XI69_9FUNG|nr:Endoribonuclease ysh1 [Smittium culicis]OMJ22345.1 Endoribonuclease ysh1 [Smittium culicis]
MTYNLKRKAKIELPIENEADLLKITPLGAGQELDCGLHPAFDGLSSLPFFDEIDPASIDVLLVTHNSGRISDEEILYNEQDMIRAYNKIEVIDFHQQIEVNGIKFTAYNAGHVLGAAMFVIEIAGIKILYTGDYSREEDRHLMAAENPRQQIDVMITESTYGVQSYEPRSEREFRFTKLVKDVVLRGGRCLMPVFALGRTQELLLILEEFWENNPELESIPIYFASTLAKRCMLVYQTYIHMMNSEIQKKFLTSNPFIFKNISYLNNVTHFDDVGPCVMIASPGMLQSGVSRDFFDKWAPDRRNGLVLTGYSVEGTLARTIMNEPMEVLTQQGIKIPRHEILPSHLILVHGEQNAMYRLKSALKAKFLEKEHSIKIYNPRNTESVKMYFKGEKMARLMGTLAVEQVPKNNTVIEGVIVERNYKYNLYQSDDLKEFEGINEVPILQKIKLPYHNTLSLLLFHLQTMYGNIKRSTNSTLNNVINLKVFNSVNIILKESEFSIDLEWFSSTLNDMIADSIVALLLNIDCSPVSVKITSSPCSHSHSDISDKHQKMSGPITSNSPSKKSSINIIDSRSVLEEGVNQPLSPFIDGVNENKDDYLSCRTSPEVIVDELADFLSEQFAVVEFSPDKSSLLIKEKYENTSYSAKIRLSDLVSDSSFI